MTKLRTVALAAFLMTGISTPVFVKLSWAQPAVIITANLAPPPLPFYVQPPVPGAGYLWSPGYWNWDPAFGYFWIPGTWVLPPRANLLWTPAYWAWNDNVFVLHAGYWGPQVGFYGGVAYGFGYTGVGFQGGYWNNGAFFYNRAVANITNVNITNVYNQTVIVRSTSNVSYNGGAAGTTVRPTPQQVSLAQQPHEPPTTAQTQHGGQAHNDPSLRASVNHGIPTIAATPRPNVFSGAGVIPASRSAGPASVGATPIQTLTSASTPHSLPTGNQLPPVHAAPTPSNMPRTAIAPLLSAKPLPAVPGAISRPAASQAAPQKSLPQPRSSPDAFATVRPRPAAQQPRVDQIERRQAQQQRMQQRMQMTQQRRMPPPGMARPAPQRFAGPSHGHRR